MMFSYMTHLSCSKCSRTYNPDTVQQLCECGSPLLVNYDLKKLAKDFKPNELLIRNHDLWRYHELLPVQSPENIVSLGEGMTPLITMKKLGSDMDIAHLYMKDEGIAPTGTFKARGAAVGVSKAKELGVKGLVMPTNGNAGAAWSLYSSKAGIQAVIIMPGSAPAMIRSEVASAGSHLYLVNGVISDAGKIAAKAAADFHLYDVSTLKEPYRIEGKKTMGFEIAEQLHWETPDVILYPAGGGVGLIAIYKAFKELQELGWVGSKKMPRFVAVQAEGCAPIVKAWKEGKRESEFWPDSRTVAFGINVPKALGDFLVLQAIYETNGCALAVKDEDILKEQKNIIRKEGAFICPEGAAAFLAARKLRKIGWIKENERVIVINTGIGLKYMDNEEINLPVLQPDESIDSLPVLP
ncbi:threonine synthase [Siminovitchia fortis]|uniref:Threonine synthase n=1 Tax=Siminovitchia fortis TaxID=254758 RepID=A0A443ING0_9BACI|nr:threonine synthase [Siminovitchia fortis]RWR07514.1 threonine synthase [Siminovitchia fortis]WHY81595.1 threonine synthase [Siminovitchia fortis]